MFILPFDNTHWRKNVYVEIVIKLLLGMDIVYFICGTTLGRSISMWQYEILSEYCIHNYNQYEGIPYEDAHRGETISVQSV